MKRFIITNLLATIILPMLACGWVESYNYYLFSAYDNRGFRERVNKTTEDNWKAYLGSTEEYYWFKADEVIAAARQKGDALMVSYVEHLKRYLDCVSIEERKQYEWNYPTAEEIAKNDQELKAIRTYALSKTGSKLRSQHALLYMRCNMMLGQHRENITFWEQTAQNFIETVYKDMMKNIYAGALYKTGQEFKAGELFADMGDYESLMTIYYQKRSYQAIRQHYQQNPTSKVLPFLLQDFVNNAQEAADGDGFGKLFVRELNRKEVWQMRNFCEEVLREGKTDTPILWKNAKAWLEYMFGDKKQAVKDILDAAKLDGTVRMKECTRVLMLYMTALQAKDSESFDNYLADEMQWLTDKEKEPGGDAYYYRAKTRLTYQALMEHYARQPVRQAALLNTTGSYNYQAYIDTMRVNQLEKYLVYTNTPATTSLDKYLKAHIEKDDYNLEDLIGTKYMRLCQWDKAIKWLEYVPASFYDQQGYRLYALLRKPSVEPWITRQRLKDEDLQKAEKYNWKIRENLKLIFAKEMQLKEGTLNILSGKALQQSCYDLAVRYAQVSYKGDCWYMMRNGKSCTDTLRVNEVDLVGKAHHYLQEAAVSSDFRLKEKALFAMSWGELYNEKELWRTPEWNSQTYEYDWKVQPQSPQYRAFSGLAELEQQNASRTSPYVSRCDEFIQFRKHF